MVIGITGNIATGKSTVAGMLGQLGAEVIDADKVAHAVMREDAHVRQRITEIFGAGILRADGEIDRRLLGAVVFSDPDAMMQLEAIVHPATINRIQQHVSESAAVIVVVEAIKLVESNLVDICHQVWITICPRSQQIARLMDGRGLSKSEAEMRIDAQPSQADKLSRADVIIDTSSTIASTEAQVQTALNRSGFRVGCDGHIRYNGSDCEPGIRIQ
ncbi:MAG: dephospho-CoA kinase [Chloroflexi bacterium]|nr:dephospho-CoA kinase [Chloroflexota bacterium]